MIFGYGAVAGFLLAVLIFLGWLWYLGRQINPMYDGHDGGQT